jgi:electron transfer flavoprotein beta subunit
MKIVVCVKQVIDPEAPVSTFSVDEEARKAIPPKGTPPVINPYDENALEAALKLKDAGAAEIAVITMGTQIAKPVVKKALAVGADSLTIIEDAAFDGLDSNASAAVLVAAIKKLGDFDLIITGRQAADTDAGQVGAGIAAMLDLPLVTAAQKIEAVGDGLRVERVTSDGYEVVECTLPAVVSASSEIGDLRMPNVKSMMAANKVQPPVWSLADLGVDVAALKKVTTEKLWQPVVEINTEVITGETPEEAGANLAAKLKADGII